MVISMDLELFWGARIERSLESCRDELLSSRRAVPALLELFSDYGVRVTWPVVGFLFCRSRQQLLDALPTRLPAYRKARLSPYSHIARIGQSEADDLVHFAPDLIDDITEAPGQEIGCHTFSNFHCGAPGANETEFSADLRAAIDVARQRNIMLRTLAVPHNRMDPELLSICRSLGISAYRGPAPSWPYISSSQQPEDPIAGRVKKWARRLDAVVPVTGTRCVADEVPADEVPVNVAATRRFWPFAGRRQSWRARMQRRRIYSELDAAARSGGVFHLWAKVRDFGRGLARLREELRLILERFEGWRRLGRMESVTMHEIVAGGGAGASDSTGRRVGGRG